MTLRPNKFTAMLEEVLESGGLQALPNIKEILDPQEGLNLLNRTSRYTPDVPYKLRLRDFDPPRGKQTHEIVYYPKILLNTAGMASSFDGSGAILCIATGGVARVFTFALCEHEWNESGANHSRGWHPKRCIKCGFDASIDSGD